MSLPRSRRWAAAAIAVLLILLVVDLVTGHDVFVIALYGLAPLVASLGSGWRTTAVVAVAALAVAAASRSAFDGMDSTNGAVFVFTVAVMGVLACAGAVARTRREASAARAGMLAEVVEVLAKAQEPSRHAARRGRRRGPRRGGPLHDRPDRPRRRPRARRGGPAHAAADGRAGARARRRGAPRRRSRAASS